jgi:hypothetical protein
MASNIDRIVAKVNAGQPIGTFGINPLAPVKVAVDKYVADVIPTEVPEEVRRLTAEIVWRLEAFCALGGKSAGYEKLLSKQQMECMLNCYSVLATIFKDFVKKMQ